MSMCFSWEIENTIDELKTHLNGRKTPIRSLKTREVVQEVYGFQDRFELILE